MTFNDPNIRLDLWTAADEAELKFFREMEERRQQRIRQQRAESQEP